MFQTHSTWGQSLLPLWFNLGGDSCLPCVTWFVLQQKLSDIDSPSNSALFLSAVLPALVDRLGDGKDQVRENSQALILRCMEQTAAPMVRWTFGKQSCDHK